MPNITIEARKYIVYELGRRAGASAEDLRRWKVLASPDSSSLLLDVGTSQKIVFPLGPETNSDVVHCAWTKEPHERLKYLVPDFVVPYAARKEGSGLPLFFATPSGDLVCSVDLLKSAFFTLNRCEESREGPRDQYGRFPSHASFAVRERFLHRPIVDEYGLALEQALRILLPQWQPRQRKFRLKLSHDVDCTGVPFSVRATIGHTLRRKKPLGTVLDLFARIGIGAPFYLRLVKRIVEVSLVRHLDSAVYWKASAPTRYDTGYDPSTSPIVEVIDWLREEGIEQGVHPGFHTFLNPDLLAEEVRRLRRVIREHKLGGRQHYLRWCPETWTHWENCGLTYDSSVGYADWAGFRAGTCWPYHPWRFEKNQPMKLLEIPLVVMDGTLVGKNYMHLLPDEAIGRVRELASRCEIVGGVFTFLCHNSALAEADMGEQLYLRLLDALPVGEKYDWKQDVEYDWGQNSAA